MSGAFGVCQFCSRKKALRKNGTLVKHYKDGFSCKGSGELPAEKSLGALRQVIDGLKQRECELTDVYKQSRDSDALDKLTDVICEVNRLQRRLKRLKKRFGHES